MRAGVRAVRGAAGARRGPAPAAIQATAAAAGAAGRAGGAGRAGRGATATCRPARRPSAAHRDRRRPPSGARGADRQRAFVPNDMRWTADAAADHAHHRPQHGRQEHLHPPGGADRRFWPRSAASSRPRRRASGVADRIFTRVGAATSWPRPEHVHGRDDRDGQHPQQRDASAAWSSSTRSAGAPAPTTASRWPGPSPSTCTTRSAAGRCSPPTTTS